MGNSKQLNPNQAPRVRRALGRGQAAKGGMVAAPKRALKNILEKRKCSVCSCSYIAPLPRLAREQGQGPTVAVRPLYLKFIIFAVFRTSTKSFYCS